jgi:pyridine nucleotide-disulfide oxidoreductase
LIRLLSGDWYVELPACDASKSSNIKPNRISACSIKSRPGEDFCNRASRERGIAVRVATLPMAAVPGARTRSETRGFMKAVIDVDNDSILGFAMLGAQAGEVIDVVQTAMWAPLYRVPRRDHRPSNDSRRAQPAVRKSPSRMIAGACIAAFHGFDMHLISAPEKALDFNDPILVRHS